MIILGIDCALDNCSVAISKNGELFAQKSVICKNNQAEILPLMVQELFLETQITPKEIGKIAITTGPGSFTGVRIGLSFAKSLAFAIDAPCIGISTLEVFAHQSAQMRALPIIKMAGSVFVAAFEGRKIIMPPTRFDNYSFLKDFENDWVLCGQGASEAQSQFQDFNLITQTHIDAFILCGLAANLSQTEAMPKPLYLRGVEAKLWVGFQGA